MSLVLMNSQEGDNHTLQLNLPAREANVFDVLPQSLSADKYYVPLSTNFAAIDALTKDSALQYCVTNIHPVKGVEVVRKIASLYPSKQLILVFVVPESIALTFAKQPILTTKSEEPKNLPSVRQYVAGLP